MPRSIGFSTERIGLAALDYPRWAVMGLCTLLLAIGISLPRVTFDEDIHRVFLSDSPLSQAQRAYDAGQSRQLSTVVIHITAPRAFTTQHMRTLRDLSLDLEFLDGVTAVASPFVMRWPPETNAPSGTPVLPHDIAENFADELAKFRALQTGLPTFLSSNLTAMLVNVSVDVEQVPISAAVAAIRSELGTALPSGLTAHITGEDVISAEIVAGLKTDLIALNLWGALLVTFAAIVLLRDLRMALLAVVPAALGAAGVLALSVWLGYPITVLSNVIPILLLVLGVADGVHLAGHLKHNKNLREAVQSIGPACGLTALTTAVAFASIALSGNAQLFEFAVLGALGTMLSFAIVIVTFALLGMWISLPETPVPSLSMTAAQRLVQIGTARPLTTIYLSFALLIASTWGFSQTKAWFPLYQNLPGSSATQQTNDAIAADFGGVFQMIIESSADWTQTQALATRLEAVDGPYRVVSLVNVARWLGRPDLRPTQDDMQSLPESLAAQLRTETGGARMFVWMPEPMRSDETLAGFDALHIAARDSEADTIIGLPAIMRFEAVRLIDQLSVSLVAAALGATVLVAFAFRSLRLIPVLIIPNTLPLMVTGAGLHMWAQGHLNPTAVLALTIAFGIAIDDTVHYLSRYRAAISGSLNPHKAAASAARSAGQVMVLTTCLLSVGLAVTLVSDFASIRLFGTMMITTLWAALLVDLLLLPALLTRKGFFHESA